VHNERIQDKKNMWNLDNEASNHMCGEKDKFMELDKVIRANITFVDHSKVTIKGKGTILIKLKDKSHQCIGDVYYIPTVKKQHIELRKIVGEYEIKMKDLTLTLLDTKEAMITKVVMTKNKVFLLNIKTDVPKCICEG
jgi:hypothetical protein